MIIDNNTLLQRNIEYYALMSLLKHSEKKAIIGIQLNRNVNIKEDDIDDDLKQFVPILI